MVAVKEWICDFLYPENLECMICKRTISKKNEYSICKDCYNGIKFIEKGCIKCGKPLSEFYSNELCPSCEKKKIIGGLNFNFERSISCVEYDDNIHRLIYRFKYSRNTYIARQIARVMAAKLLAEGIMPDFLTFIPLSAKRFDFRGFNQSQMIADCLGEMVEIEVLNLAIRIKNTSYLSKLSKEERKNELSDAFKVRFYGNDIKRLKRKKLLVVDDIFTTGKTMDEFSKTIKVLGFDKIYTISFASGRNIF